MSNETYSALFADSARGIYIPQHFAESHNPEHWTGINPEDLAILKTGPEHDQYWDAWSDTLDNAETTDGGKLHQDGDLWVIWPERAIETINTYCTERLDYEENHVDAGDAYAHMPAESWSTESDKRLREECERHEIDTRNLDSDTLADIALDLFRMQRGSILGPYCDGIILDAFPIQEIEIDIREIGVDGIALEYVANSCEPYIRESLDYAYLTTDAVWFTLVDPQAFQAAIHEHVAENNA